MRRWRYLLLLAPLLTGACMARPGLEEARAVFGKTQSAILADAACAGRGQEIEQLLRSGVPVDGVGQRSTTPLAWAVGCENVIGVRELLDAGADPNHLIDGKYTVFWAAAGHDNVDILNAMVEHGANINFRAPDEDTPLMRSVLLGAWRSFDYLVEAGADLNSAGPITGRTVATQCIAAFRFDKVIELMDKGYRYDLLLVATRANALPLAESAKPGRDRLLEVLRAHGVEWPLPALLTDEARAAYMAEHPAYAQLHPESAPKARRRAKN